MKKFIISLLTFIVFAVFFYVTALYVVGLYLPDYFSSNLRNYKTQLTLATEEAKRTKDVDILFLGTSHAYLGFDPRIFKKNNLTSFILASRSQSPNQTEVLIDRYIDRLNPKLVVYEVSARLFTSYEKVNNVGYFLIGDSIDSLSLQLALETKDIEVYNNLIFGILVDLLNKRKELPVKLLKRAKYIEKGYVESNSSYSKKVEIFKLDDNWSFNKKTLYDFNKVVKKIKDRGIKIVFVTTPFAKEYYSSIAKVYKKFSEQVGGHGSYINFNEILKMNDSLCFGDPYHLNKRGAELFSEKFIKVLEENDFVKP